MLKSFSKLLASSENLNSLHSFITSNDPQWKAFSTDFQIKLTKDIIKIFLVVLTIGYIYSGKSLLNVIIVLSSGTLMAIYTRPKTVALMNCAMIVSIMSIPWLRLFLIGKETLMYNQLYTSIAVLPVMMFSKSYTLTGLAFIYVLIFNKFNGEKLLQDFRSSPANFEETLVYLINHCHIICLMVVIYAVMIVYQNQIIIAKLWEKQKEAEILLQQLNHRNESLIDINQSKNKLLLSLSHEFRNPINAALGNLELAREKNNSLSLREKYLTNCKVSIETLFHLVSNLLDSTKLEAEILELNQLNKSPRAIFQKAWEIVRNLLEKQNLVGEFYIHKSIPKMLNLDSHFLTKIFLNLILNSLKYTNQGAIMIVVTWLDETQITENMLQPSQTFLSRFFTSTRTNSIGLTKESEQEVHRFASLSSKSKYSEHLTEIPTEAAFNLEKKVSSHCLNRLTSIKEIEKFHEVYESFEKFSNADIQLYKSNAVNRGEQEKEAKKRGILKIEVFDSGCGIDPEIKEDLFKKFSPSYTKNRDRLGTGLGLWITKNLCDIMKGQIRAYSEINKGSQFVVALPFESGGEVYLTKPYMASHLSPIITALVVDDDKYNREVHTAFLKRAGVTIKDEAANGAEALQLFISKPANYYDLILMDLEMPVMDGKAAVRKIRAFEKLQMRRPSKIIIATGNCDSAEYSACMSKEGDIRADFFYRKPLFQKDVEEFVKRITEA